MSSVLLAIESENLASMLLVADTSFMSVMTLTKFLLG